MDKQIFEIETKIKALIDAGKFDETYSLSDELLGLSLKYYGEKSLKYANLLPLIITVLNFKGDFIKSEKLAMQCLEITEIHMGKNSELYIDRLNTLISVYHKIGKYFEAIELSKKAISSSQKLLGEENQYYARSLMGLAGVYYLIGLFDKAEPLMVKAYNIYQQVLGDENLTCAGAVNNLAILYHAMGNYSVAKKMHYKGMELINKLVGEKHPFYAQRLNNLANLCLATGEYSTAKALYEKAVSITKSMEGKTFNYAFYGFNLAAYYISHDDANKAKPLLFETLEILKNSWGEQHPSYAMQLIDVGNMYLNLGKYDEAGSIYKQSIAIWETSISCNNYYYAFGLNKLANIFYIMGEFEKSSELVSKVIHIYSEVLGKSHPEYSEVLVLQSLISAFTNHEIIALESLNDASLIQDEMIMQILSTGSESQKLDFIKKIQPSIDIHLSLVIKHFTDSLKVFRETLDLVLRRKAITAEALAAQRDAVYSGKYPELVEKLHDLTILRTQIAMKELKGPTSEEKEYHDKLISEWKEKRDNLESELARQIPEMNLEERLRQADRKAVAKVLPKDSVLVEFVKFNEYDFKAIPAKGEKHWKPARYLAFVLPSGDPDNIRMIDLGEAEAIDKLIDNFRASVLSDFDVPERSATTVKSNIKKPDNDTGKTLRKAVFDKIEDGIKGYSKIFIAPDGNLSRLPFEVLPTSDGRYLIDDYNISYLSVGRDMLRFERQSSGSPVAALVVADPNFDMGRDMSLEPGEPETEFSFAKGWRKSRDFDRTSLKFDRLPGTRPESDKVSDLLKTKSWLDNEVLESKLKAVHSPYIMHLATHGFFLEDQRINLEKESGQRYENPLLRSGLALAGANTFIKGGTLPDEAEDGILTAEDVSGLDLTETEMVVLSACDTGLGEIRTGEGVFGLRRSFMLAGAKTLVMSLWKIPDLATPILMERFYENLINRKMGRAESLRDAQIHTRDITLGEVKKKWLTDEMIGKLSAGNEAFKRDLIELTEQPDDHTPFKAPIYWGAFICQGDPRPIKMK
ncbi:CHAT domain-containing protein [bacterium]|nr:CHAT domain-containing protein [bacterium]